MSELSEQDKSDVKQLVSYFSHRSPYRGDEAKAEEAAVWAIGMTKRAPIDLAVLLLETFNERNSLRRRVNAINVLATNADFIENASVESVEWAFGGKLSRTGK